jgi:ABC-type phosphate/phosphonate transport system substrate-binding protein
MTSTTCRLGSILRVVFLATVACVASTSVVAQEEIIFSTPPTQSAAQTVKAYGPLAEYLSQVTGKQITLTPARSFLEYSNKMRAGEYDLLFDGPHFIGYRMEKLGHLVLAKVPGELRFVVVAKDDSPVESVDQLIGKKVCGPASPNLATLSFLDQLPNPVRQPIMVPTTGFGPALKCVRQNKAEAAVLRDKFWERQDHSGLKVIYVTERPLPGRGFSISPGVDASTRAKIQDALIGAQGDELAKKALAPIGGGSKGFVRADPAEFEGLGRLLKGVWGFHE